MKRKRIRLQRSAVITCVALAAAFGTSLLVSGTAAATGARQGQHDSSALTGSQKKALKAALAKVEGSSKFVTPGPALPAAKVKALKGDSIMIMGEGENEFSTLLKTGIEQAAAAVGLHVVYFESTTVATTTVHDIDTALAEHVKAIILECTDPTTISSAIEQAKADHVTVIAACTGDPRLPTAKAKAMGVYGEVTYTYTQVGKLVGEYDVLATNGKVDALVQYFKGLGASDDTAAGFRSALKEYCPKTCSATYSDVSLSAAESDTQSSATAALANPNVNVFFPVYDFMATFDEPLITSAHATTRVIMATQNADLAPMQDIAAGGTAIKAEIGDPTEWEGWASVDQALRGMVGVSAVKSEHVPIRLFDSANIKSVNLKATPSSWYGPANFRADFKRVWGVGK